MKLDYSLGKSRHSVTHERTGDDFQVPLDGERTFFRLLEYAPPRITFSHNGRIVTAYVVGDGSKRWIHVDGATVELVRGDGKAKRTAASGTRDHSESGIITAPMPGQLRGVMVKEGDTVTEGQPLVVLEAMKMEVKVSAPYDGVVTKLLVAEGQSVEREQELGEITRRNKE